MLRLSWGFDDSGVNVLILDCLLACLCVCVFVVLVAFLLIEFYLVVFIGIDMFVFRVYDSIILWIAMITRIAGYNSVVHKTRHF